METLVKQANSKAEQAELKQEYLDIIRAEVWKDQRMLDHCAGKVAHIVRLSNGDILVIEKETIEKDFCFGYSDSRYNTDDYDRANNMAAHAKSSEEYFISENMEGINRKIALLDGSERTRYKYSLRVQYYGQPENSKLKCLDTFDPYDGKEVKEISAEDRALILAGYRIAREDFVKRLNQYLKRYGLSKVHSWSYWQDE